MNNEHYHIMSGNGTGDEYLVSVHEDKVDAALNYMAIMQSLMRYTPAFETVNIERVMNAINGPDEGMNVYTDTLHLKITGCTGNCFSPSWN